MILFNSHWYYVFVREEYKNCSGKKAKHLMEYNFALRICKVLWPWCSHFCSTHTMDFATYTGKLANLAEKVLHRVLLPSCP